MTIIAVCVAPVHGTAHAHDKYGCVCPDAVDAHRARDRRHARNRYVRGRICNRRGPRKGIDEIAVERAVGGDRSIVLTHEERFAAIDQLDSYGMSAADVARRLGVTTRTVQRRRAARRHATAPSSRMECTAA